jgi:hypothetical protein
VNTHNYRWLDFELKTLPDPVTCRRDFKPEFEGVKQNQAKRIFEGIKQVQTKRIFAVKNCWGEIPHH